VARQKVENIFNKIILNLKLSTIMLQIMKIEPHQLYHVYNRGNNKQKIFFEKENAIDFLKRIRKYLSPNCEILAYCLMPNHFHLMIYADERSAELKDNRGVKISVFAEGIKNLLSSYSQAINRRYRRTGSLFTQNTKAKELVKSSSNDYPFTCFNYIHQNAYSAKLVEKMEDWEMCSFIDYVGLRNGTLCNKDLAKKLLDLNWDNFYNESYKVISPDKLGGIW
jgi:putative transposase